MLANNLETDGQAIAHATGHADRRVASEINACGVVNHVERRADAFFHGRVIVGN